MKNILTIALAITLCAIGLQPVSACAAVGQSQASRSAEVQLKAALHKEQAEGDLKGAIEQYKKIAAQPGAGRATVATALLRMGQCHEKLGNAEARTAYQRLVREFADQAEIVAQARVRLAALGGARSGMVSRQVWSGPKATAEGTVSSDGRYLSYVDWDTGDLALHDFAANADRRLTNKGTWEQSYEFAEESAISRDGKQVAYSWYNTKERYELRIVSMEAAGFPQPRRLFDNEDVTWIGPHDWSPDGKWLAVVLERKDRTGQIGLVSLEDGSLRVLKSAGRQPYPNEMFFSPDSKYLGISLLAGDNTVNERDVFVLAIDGSRDTRAVVSPAQGRMMGWSPDGKRLLFASDRSRGTWDLWALPVADGKPQGEPELIKTGIGPPSLGVTTSGALYFAVSISDQDIQVASLDFNTGRLLSPPVRPVQSFIGPTMQPDWSPDGKSLAYVSARNRGRRLEIRSLETGRVRELNPSLTTFNSPRWAPDGRSFVCQGSDFNGRQGLWQIDAQTGEVAPIATSQSGGQMPQWSPDGKKIYYTINAAMIERDLASGSEREVVRRTGLRAPSVSPDGRYIAARSFDPSTKSWAVLLIPIDGGEPRELLRVNPPQSLFAFVTWMPDGRGLIVRKFLDENPARSELYLVPVADGQPRKLDLDLDTRATRQAPIRVHPDGRQIAYEAGKTSLEIWVLENFLPPLKVVK